MNCTARQGCRQHQLLLQRELGQWAASLEVSLTPVHQRIVHTLDWLNMDSLLGYTGKRVGPPEGSRVALAQAFVAKAVLGFESNRARPSEATFSRAFAQFARMGLPAQAHEALIRSHLGDRVIGHIARDSTAIQARERAHYSTAETAALNAAKAAQQDKQPKRKARPPAGTPATKPRSRIPAQLLQTPQQALADLP